MSDITVSKDQFWMEKDKRFTRLVRVLHVGELYVRVITTRDDGTAKAGARESDVVRSRFEKTFMYLRN